MGRRDKKITTTTSTHHFGHHANSLGNGNDENIWLQRVSLSQYSFFANTTDRSDSKTFDMSANINWSRERFEEYTSSSPRVGTDDGDDPGTASLRLNIHWVNSIAASARYNRSLTDHNGINIAESDSNEKFIVSSIMANTLEDECYKAEASASNGSFIVDGRDVDGKSIAFDFNCRLPSGILFCGQELCGLLDFESKFWTNARARKDRNGRNGKTNDKNGKSPESLPSRNRNFWRFLVVCFIIIVGCAVYWEAREGKILSVLRLHINSRRRGSSNNQTPPLNVAILSEEGDHLLMT